MSLITLVLQISQASLSHLFRHICGFTPKELEALGLDEELLLVLILSAQLRLLRRKVSKDFHTRFRHEVHPSTGVCRLCYFEPEDSKCIRYWTVQSTPHTEIHGKVVTPYPTNDPDRLTPTLVSMTDQTTLQILSYKFSYRALRRMLTMCIWPI